MAVVRVRASARNNNPDNWRGRAVSVRLPEVTHRQVEDLKGWLGESRTGVVVRALERLWARESALRGVKKRGD